MSQSVSKNPRKTIRCIYFYKRSKNSPRIMFAILTDDYRYAEFSFNTFCGKFGVTLIRRFKDFFRNFKLNCDTDVVFSENFARGDSIRMYFDLIRDHILYRMSTLDLRKAIRGVARRHPRSVMTKREIEYHKRGTKDPGKVGEGHLNKVWKYLVDRNHGVRCPWITREVDYWILNKYQAEARRCKQLRLVMYYLALKNDLYSVEGARDAHYAEIAKKRREEDSHAALASI